MTNTLSLTLFGQFQAALNDKPLTRFRTRKVQALLIYLVADPGPHRRESLMELLWPGMPERSARQNLRQVIYNLRQRIPELMVKDKVGSSLNGRNTVPFLIANRQTIQLNPAAVITADVGQFQGHLQTIRSHTHIDLLTCHTCRHNLETAVTLYQDDFLADFYLDDSNKFEEWAESNRVTYRRHALDALETLTTIYTRQKSFPQARLFAERQLELDDLRECAYRQLMEILALDGQREEALARYEQCRRLLADELGMAPTSRTTAIYDKIVAGDLRFDETQTQGVRGYDLKDEIGEGAYGTIYRAVQPTIGRDVAIKVIRRRYANDPEFIRRFEAEAQTIARLEHPYIVPLYDYWRDPEGAYLVMRLLRGGNMLDALKDGQWLPEKAVPVITQIASALAAAHQQGIVHRDIKPANILFDKSGNAFLSDFGIAKDLGGTDQHTGVGVLLRTPDYVSPEQLRSESVTAQSDIYSLGAVLYETLTGEKPFPEMPPAMVIHKHLEELIPPINATQPGLPAQIDEVIQRATAKRPSDRYEDALAMAEAFRQAVEGKRAAHTAPITAVTAVVDLYNPYKGLQAFQETDADDFFGRETLVEQLVAQMNGSRFLALVGPSGSGKSSVVKAGLIPALRQEALPGSDNWFVAEMIPGTHPLEELELALLPIAVNPPPDMVEPMQKDERGLLRTIRRILPDEENAQLLLVIDQFEELFTLVDDDQRRLFFLNSLLTALNAPRSPLRLLVTLRADFYDRPLQIQPMAELFKQHTEIILPMMQEELTWAIQEPARRMGVGLEPSATAVMLTEIANQPGALPLLQYALTELFEERQDNMMTLAAYRALGGVSGALAQRAEEVYLNFEARAQEAARQLFLRLVTLGEGAEDTRRRVCVSELEAVQTSKDSNDLSPSISKVLEKYGGYRLLTFDHDPLTREPTVEVAHEALLREWPRLRRWLEKSRDDVRLQRSLADFAAEWANNNRDAGFLLRGSRLDLFADWSAEMDLALTPDEQAFLAATITAREQREMTEQARQQRELETAQQLAETERQRAEEQSRSANRLRILAAGLAIILLLAIAAAWFAADQGRAAQTQAAILLAAEAESELEAGFYDRAVLLALEALQNYPYTPQAERALGRAVSYNRALGQYDGHNSAVTSVDWSPEGRRIASTSSDNTVQILDADTGETTLVIPLPEGITGNVLDMGLTVKWSPDGKRLAVLTGDRYLLGSQDYDLSLWDAITGEQITTVEIVNEAIDEQGGGVGVATSFTHYATNAGLDFAGENGQLASLGGDNSALVWDTDLTGPILTLIGHENDVNSIQWSPDETRLATASLDGTARIWDAKTGGELFQLEGHEGQVTTARWSPDDAFLATAGEDGQICIWEVESGSKKRCILSNYGPIWSLTWSGNGSLLTQWT